LKLELTLGCSPWSCTACTLGAAGYQGREADERSWQRQGRSLGGIGCGHPTLNLPWPQVVVSSVDGYQGREADVVVFSTVRCNPQRRLGFVTDPRRMNVAITRPRRCGARAAAAARQRRASCNVLLKCDVAACWTGKAPGGTGNGCSRVGFLG